MQIQVVNKGIDVSEALRERIQERLGSAVLKLSSRPGEAFVVIERERFWFRVDCSVHLPSGALLRSCATGGDAYGVAEIALDRLERRLRRYKGRLVDRRSGRAGDASSRPAAADEPPEDEREDTAAASHVVVAETAAEVPVLTVGMAALELELANAPVLMFKNAAHGAMNVVYRRPDGHIGWIDPGRGETRAARPS